MGNSKNPLVLTGDAMDQTKMLQHLRETHNISILNLWVVRMMLGYFFRDLDLAGEMEDLIFSNPLQLATKNHQVMTCYFYGGLTAIALYGRTGRRNHRVRARKSIKGFETPVRAGAVNCYDMLLFLYAEETLVKQKDTDIIKQAYDKAIASSSRSGFTHHAALANERAGLFFLGRNDKEWGEFYLAQAFQLYTELGTMAKVAQLREKHDFLASGRRIALKQSRFLKGRPRFNHNNEAKHKGEMLRDLLRSTTDSNESLTAHTRKQILDLHE